LLPGDSNDQESVSSGIVHFYEDLIQEIEYHNKRRTYLTIDENRILRYYYHDGIFARALGYSLAPLLSPVVRFIVSQTNPIRVLDSGCGLGSESILFGMFGANVVGIDMRKERIAIAKKRLAYYEDRLGKPLQVSFQLQNILTFHDDDKFDIVWNSQSISHIHPAERYFQVVFKNLRDNGHFVICESNALNPYIAWSTWLIHLREGSRKVVPDPVTCVPAPYAIEKLFYPRQLSNILKAIGFNIDRLIYYNFVPRRFSTAHVFKKLNQVLSGTPILRAIGASYVLVANRTK
jgi:SAM-dependent methyltransferase